MTQTSLPSPVQLALDKAERANQRFRILLWTLAVALVAATAYFGMANASTTLQELLVRGLLIVGIMIVLVGVRLRYSIVQSTQSILRAIYAQRQ